MTSLLPKEPDYSAYSNLLAKVADICILVSMGYLCFWIYFRESMTRFESYQWLVFAGAVMIPVLFSQVGVYRSSRKALHSDLIVKVARGYIWLAFLILGYLFLSKQGAFYSRFWVGLWLCAGFSLTLVARVLAYNILRRLRNTVLNGKTIALIGNLHSCLEVWHTLNNDPGAGYSVSVLRVNEDPDTIHCPVQKTDIAPIAAQFMNFSVDEVWICLPIKESERLIAIMELLSILAVNVRYFPDMKDFRLINHKISYIANRYALDLNISPIQGTRALIKYLEDKCLVLIALMILSPILILITVALLITCGRPILFRQQRISWNGKPFEMLKFRSMPLNPENDTVWGNADKKQKTRLGAFLRRTSLDELPQLLNVLSGKMSLVGPRPEQTHFVEKFKHKIPGYMQKHMMKAGITGWAQIHGLRGDTDLRKRIEFDLWYVENWSLWLDIKILYLTFFRFLSGKIR